MTKDKIISGLKMTMELFLFDPSTGETCEPDDLNELNRTTYDACKGAVELLGKPEPHWIPVTEATPTEDDDYWATFDAETGRFVDWASWYQGRWVTWIEGSPAPLSNVIAWCKPMEPYKGVTE